MAAADEIRANLDISQIAQHLGTDEQTAGRAVDEALDQLVGALDTNAADPQCALNLTRALGDHTGVRAFAGPIDIDRVDTEDGSKIVDHVFSAGQVQSLGSPGAGGDLLRRLLPILAPIVMGYLANKLQDHLRGGAGGAAAGGAAAPADAGAQQGQGGLGGILGDLLGGLFGGGSQPSPDPQAAAAPQAPTAPPPGGAGAQAGASGGTGSGGIGSGGFRVPEVGDPGLRMDPGTTDEPAPGQAPSSQQAGGALGGILSDLLRGRR